MRFFRTLAETLARRYCAAVHLLFVAIVLIVGPFVPRPAQALDPGLSITQYTHRSWIIGFNGLGTAPLSITQLPDGYLLFGAQDGVYRFNGERFQRWHPWGTASHKINYVSNLLLAHDGSLYLSLIDGLARYKNGKIFFFKEQLVEPYTFEDRHGRIWIGQTGWHGVHNGICHVSGERVLCRGSADGALCPAGISASPDPHGGILSFGENGLCRITGTGRESRIDYPGGQSMRYARVVWDRAGHVYALLRNSVRESYLETNGRGWKAVPSSHKIGDGRILFKDREGALWIGTWRAGLWRVFNGHAQHYTHADGLSSNTVAAIFEDREGSVWVATSEGVDQFRAPAIVRFTAREGLSGDRPASLFVTRSGELWVPNVDGVDAFRDGRLLAPAPQASSRPDVFSLVQDSEGEVWSLIGGVGIFYQNERKPVRNDLHVPLKDPQDLAATPDGNVWTGGIYKNEPIPRGTLVQMRAGRVVAAFPTPASVDRAVIYKLAPDGSEGLWVAVVNHGALLFRNGRFAPLRLPAHTNVVAITPIKTGAAWMATIDGLYHVEANGPARHVGMAEGLPCENFSAVTISSKGDLWVKADCGLLHLAKDQLDSFLAGKVSRLLADQIDAADGAPVDDYDMHPATTPDGRIWFSNLSGLFMVNPTVGNRPRPRIPAFVDDVIADGQIVLPKGNRRSPTRPRRIEITFSGIDFDRPDRLAFRYELSRGRQHWRGETAEKTVSFTDLGPGAYRFKVIACENGRHCGLKPAVLTFEIPPTFAQTWMFKIAMAFIAAFFAWAAYRLWHRQVSLDIQRRTEARLGERERIARDLHDTLLQGFQGLLLRLQGAVNSISREDPLRSRLESALNRGEQIIVEGRNRVRDLRVDENGLPEILRKFVEEASLDFPVNIELEIQGFPSDLRRGIATEVGQIAREALSNACRHANATRIAVTAEFALRQLNVRITDNGKGMGAQSSRANGSSHFGLSGMRERAERMKGFLTIDSAAGKGTEVSLSLASNVAYVPKGGFFQSCLVEWKIGSTTKAVDF